MKKINYLTSFNQDLSNWDISGVKTFSSTIKDGVHVHEKEEWELKVKRRNQIIKDLLDNK